MRRTSQQSTAIRAGIEYELPVVVMILLVELTDGLVVTGAGHTHNWSTPKNRVGTYRGVTKSARRLRRGTLP